MPAAQDVKITENITTTAEAAGSKAAASETFAVTAQDTHKISAKATGWSLAGGASGGLTNIKVTITNTTTAGVDQSIGNGKEHSGPELYIHFERFHGNGFGRSSGRICQQCFR